MEVLKKIVCSFNSAEALRLKGVEQKSIFHWYKGEDQKIAVAMLKEPLSDNVSAWTVPELAAAIGATGQPYPVAFMPPGFVSDMGPDGRRVERKPHWLYFTIRKSVTAMHMADAYAAHLLDLIVTNQITPEEVNENIQIFHANK